MSFNLKLRILIYLTLISVISVPCVLTNENWLRCEKIKTPVCENIGYNSTMMPNFVGHNTLQDAENGIQLFAPLIQYNCSAHLRLFICSVYVPFCSEQIPGAIPACRSLCENVRNDCKPHLDRIGRDWPPELACERFPNPPNLCFENPKEDKISEKFKTSENYKNNLTFQIAEKFNFDAKNSKKLKNLIKVLYLVKMKNLNGENGNLDLKNLDNLSKLKNLVTLLSFLKLKNLTSENLGFGSSKKEKLDIKKPNFENMEVKNENLGSEKPNLNLEYFNQKNLKLENLDSKNLDLEKLDLQGLNLKDLNKILDLDKKEPKPKNSENLKKSISNLDNLKNATFDNLNVENQTFDNSILKNINPENLDLENLNLENVNLPLHNLNLNLQDPNLNPLLQTLKTLNLNLENLNLENLSLDNLNLENLQDPNNLIPLLETLKTFNLNLENPQNFPFTNLNLSKSDFKPYPNLKIPETLQCPTRFIPIDDQCSPICGQDAFYKKRDKIFTKKWTITWAVGCAIATTFTLITYTLDTKNKKLIQKNKKQSQIKLINNNKNNGAKLATNKIIQNNAKLATKIQNDVKLATNKQYDAKLATNNEKFSMQHQLNVKIKKTKRQKLKFQYPERPILYMSVCCLLYSLVTLSRVIIGGEFFVCTTDGKLVTKSSQNMFCALSAVLTQFLTLSVRLWWVIFCICWNLHTTYEWSPESLSKLSNWFHGVVNTLSLIPPVISLLTSQISADELTGSCTIKEEVSLYYIFLPQFLLLIFGGLISIRTTFSLCYIRNSLHIFGRTTISKLEKLMLRFCIFTVTYVLIEFCYLVCVAYESWHRPWWKSLALLSALDNPEPIYHTASIEVVLLKILFSFFVGICTVMWVCSGKTLRTWETIFCKRVFRPKLMKPINV